MFLILFYKFTKQFFSKFSHFILLPLILPNKLIWNWFFLLKYIGTTTVCFYCHVQYVFNEYYSYKPEEKYNFLFNLVDWFPGDKLGSSRGTHEDLVLVCNPPSPPFLLLLPWTSHDLITCVLCLVIRSNIYIKSR